MSETMSGFHIYQETVVNDHRNLHTIYCRYSKVLSDFLQDAFDVILWRDMVLKEHIVSKELHYLITKHDRRCTGFELRPCLCNCLQVHQFGLEEVHFLVLQKSEQAQ